MAQQQRRIVVVGGGLAGIAAALSAHAELQSQSALVGGGAHPDTMSTGVLDPGATAGVEVVIVDKEAKLGGNSAKASSGINAVNPAAGDTPALFTDDTLQSGGGLSVPELVATLVGESEAAIAFLTSYGVDLSGVTQLGGHSKPRSRTNPTGGAVGWSIMSKVMAAVKALPGVRVLEGHKLEEVVLHPTTGAVQGVVLAAARAGEAATQTVLLPAQAVILATGGYAANRTLLAQHCPAAADLATTNGPWAQGDALRIAEAAGAALRDLDQVQVHPTGFVDPASPGAGTKFLAPEKLRGVGAVLLNADGQRFVDELGRRDHVAAALTSARGSEALLVLSNEGAIAYGQQAIGFYAAKGLMAKVEGLEGLASHLGVPVQGLRDTLTAYIQAANGQVPDPWGKTVFPGAAGYGALLGGSDAGGEPQTVYVARVTPVVHYTMGGIAMDQHARVLKPDNTPIPGLYVAGEASGGVHGRNRLGGNSLLECVVYGRTAGKQAALGVLGLESVSTVNTATAASAL